MHVIPLSTNQISHRLNTALFQFWGVSSVCLLALNDWILKPKFHNWLTGKISDFAGCFMFPLFLETLFSLIGFPRKLGLKLGIVFTVIFFSSLKLSTPFGDIFCSLVSPLANALGLGAHHQIVADPTDLWALFMVPIAWLYSLNPESK